ncbi:hypothetical protein STRMOE7_30050 [Streptomyces sp. MOE7]|nr:hypothetical protein STRMOE7_30050 [Streptomyces sp. MOE7]
MAGGAVGVSAAGPLAPSGRLNHSPVFGLRSVNSLTLVGAGSTTTALFGWKPAHLSPTTFMPWTCFGVVSGLPHLQRTRGTPYGSTMTAVPAWSTDWNSYALPSL